MTALEQAVWDRVRDYDTVAGPQRTAGRPTGWTTPRTPSEIPPEAARDDLGRSAVGTPAALARSSCKRVEQTPLRSSGVAGPGSPVAAASQWTTPAGTTAPSTSPPSPRRLE